MDYFILILKYVVTHDLLSAFFFSGDLGFVASMQSNGKYLLESYVSNKFQGPADMGGGSNQRASRYGLVRPFCPSIVLFCDLPIFRDVPDFRAFSRLVLFLIHGL